MGFTKNSYGFARDLVGEIEKNESVGFESVSEIEQKMVTICVEDMIC